MLPGIKSEDSATRIAARSASCPEPARGRRYPWFSRNDSRRGSLTRIEPQRRTPTGLTCSYLTSVTFGQPGRRFASEQVDFSMGRRCASSALYPRPERRGFTAHLVNNEAHSGRSHRAGSFRGSFRYGAPSRFDAAARRLPRGQEFLQRGCKAPVLTGVAILFTRTREIRDIYV